MLLVLTSIDSEADDAGELFPEEQCFLEQHPLSLTCEV